MKALVVFLAFLCCIGANQDVQNAIQLLREKLNGGDANQAKLQFTLGLLLESTPDADVGEIASLYREAGSSPSLEVTKRLDSLCRSARVYHETLGDLSQAAECYRQALLLVEDPDHVGEVLQQATPVLIPEASNHISLAKDLVRKFPNHAMVHQFHGALLRKLGKSTEAYQAYHLATLQSQQSDQTKAEALILAAAAARKAGVDTETQMKYLQAAQTLDLSNDASTLADLYNQMGVVQKHGGNRDAAVQYFQQALQAKKDDGHAMAQLASLNVDMSGVQSLDAEYVKDLFDGYSSHFEHDLLETLEYRGHEMTVNSLKRAWTTCEKKSPIVIDLGCGTGLVGEQIAKWKKVNIIGIDLSESMIQQAKYRTMDGVPIYSEVHQQDAHGFLRGILAGSIDAIVAADVFIYIGDIDDLLALCVQSLVEGGLVVFTVESTFLTGLRLLPSGRFGHSKAYIEQVASKHGLAVIEWKDDVLRKQRGADVAGASVVLQKQQP